MGANDEHVVDAKMQGTVAYNRFGEGLVQRMPRCRLGFFQVVNNDYNQWQMYAIGGSQKPTIISQGNRFVAPPMPEAKGVTMRFNATEEEWRNWNWRSEDDLFENGAIFVESGQKVNPQFSSMEFIQAEPGSMAERLTSNSGYLNCRENLPC